MILKTFDQFLHEDVQKLLKEPSSIAGKEAKQLGLQYYGFGKYGKGGHATHVVVNQHLMAINKKMELDKEKSKKHEDVVNHSKGLKGDPKLTQMKKKNPDAYKNKVSKAGERLKAATQKLKGDEAVYKQLDQAEPEFKKFVQEKVKESEDLHKKMVGHYDWRGLTDEEKKTLIHYSEEGYKEIKETLSSGKKPHHFSHHAKYLGTLQSVMDKTDAPTNLWTYAGYTGEPLDKGKEYTIPELKSTTTNIDIALAYLSDEKNKSIISFKIRKHQQGFYMDGNNSEAVNQGEREFLLPQNTVISITDEPQVVHITDDNVVTFYNAVILDKITQETSKKTMDL